MKSVAGFGVLLAAVLACLATSAPRSERNYPAWVMKANPARDLPCGTLDAWVGKSGKEGMGVVVQIGGATEQPCKVKILGARFNAGGQWIAAQPQPAELAVGRADKQEFWLPFAFDNEALWNAGKNSGALVVGLDVNGEPQPDLQIPMEHELHGYHRARTLQQ